ncbi:mandelate racemase [Mucilaginibacter robiniae]|uniref:Mandelate racemase n=1 Tax=Mucilaginibacter robiniae TaxID=2728022 RepID=A0A7L5E6D4_9SPHI|nr:enolase C-terminal domain-like protein [Mucilaginibacter robiniae]QJD98198.1 mandelate racemase [Mucilaginibacter robiniae]
MYISDTISNLRVSAYKIPTDYPESDGTLEWDSTILVWVEIEALGTTGVGYTYAHQATAYYIEDKLKSLLIGQNPMEIPAMWQKMLNIVRNDGTAGISCAAISAVDNALWDLKAKILNLPLATLLGMVRPDMPLYGSGGFTSYPDRRLQEQFTGWLDKGIKAMKMKIGREPDKDFARAQAAKAVMGGAELMIDANGAFTPRIAVATATKFAELGVCYFEEPVSSDNLQGLHFIRQQAPAAMQIAAGEYGYSLWYFAEMLKQQAVDILQADATRCCGITGFLKVGYLCESHQTLFSSHCAPSIHLHAAVALNSFYLAEYFHDHVRIENLLFDGVQQPINGVLKPDLTRPGIGIELKYADAESYKIL